MTEDTATLYRAEKMPWSLFKYGYSSFTVPRKTNDPNTVRDLFNRIAPHAEVTSRFGMDWYRLAVSGVYGYGGPSKYPDGVFTTSPPSMGMEFGDKTADTYPVSKPYHVREDAYPRFYEKFTSCLNTNSDVKFEVETHPAYNAHGIFFRCGNMQLRLR